MATADLAQSIGRELPFLRRYARALTGSQSNRFALYEKADGSDACAIQSSPPHVKHPVGI